MGAQIYVSDESIVLYPGSLQCTDVVIPGDISSAAFWLVAGSILPGSRINVLNVGINPTRSGIIDVLRSMGADIYTSNERTIGGEPVADLRVSHSNLNAVNVGGNIIPRLIDEIPLVALAGCVAKGKTTIRDARELRFKETDRISGTVYELRKMGVRIEELPDGMVIQGDNILQGARCDSHDDHRLAMMLSIAALVAKGTTEIANSDAVNISYPEFWEDMDQLRSNDYQF
jgi:3-phosphoshikimate 1-carboxyvinyltransferase